MAEEVRGWLETDYKAYLRHHELDAHLGYISPWHRPLSREEWFWQQPAAYRAWILFQNEDSFPD